METLAGFPFARLTVDKDGAMPPHAGVDLPPGITDLIVISHGWKNDEHDALMLYGTLLGHMREIAADALTANGRSWAVTGVFWPAFRFLPDLTLLPVDGGARAAPVAAGVGDSDLPREELAAYAGALAGAFGIDTASFAQAAVAAAAGGDAASDFVATLRGALTPAADLAADHSDLLEKRGNRLIEDLRSVPQGKQFAFERPRPDAAAGGAGGAAAGLHFHDVVDKVEQWASGGRAAIARLLNQATYYEMKARAGVVGTALAPVVEPLSGNATLHLVGHSFGARLVSALANALTASRPRSLSLLQGAFSHNGFGSGTVRRDGGARIDGVFRKVVGEKRVTGPMLVTHTRNDTAVGFYYALASTFSQDVASGRVIEALIGGPDDKHGGLGANGALSLMPGEGKDHVATVGAVVPPFAPGLVHNVLADAIISDHNAVTNPDVARLVWAAVG